MTSLDFKALRKKERAKLQRQKQQENQYQNKGTLSRIHLDAPLILAHRFSLDLIKFKVSPGAIDGIYYVPEWLSEEDARQLLEAIDQAPAGLWTNLQNRRLQNLGGTPASATGKGMRCLPVPSYGHAMFEALVAAGVFASDTAPNHILLNEYSNGQGIALHKDGPLYQNRVAIVSLGAPALIEFWDRPHLNDLNAPRCSGSNFPSHPSSATVRLEHRSLLVFEGDAYEKYWHGILRRHELPAEESGDRGKEDRRVSLTVRRVLNVCEADKEMLETAETVREEKRENARFLMSISDDR
ncbi:alpha-ketoglutarate-dependent dioxygenase alkb homolog 6 [Nannochloropsis oceanica]